MAQTKIKLVADGVIDSNHLKAGHTITTDNIGEGTNLYYTDARVGSYLSTNSYATEGYVTTAVANLVDAAPSTLDTLNELAAALGDDPNFATTVTNSIAEKLPLAGGTLTGDLIVDADVGIGTSSPSRKLTVVANGFGLRAQQSTDATQFVDISGNQIAAYQSGAGGSLYLNWSSGGNIIAGSGNVGIGTDTPSGLLTIYKNTPGSLGGHIVLNNGGTAVANETAVIFQDGGSTVTRAAIATETEDNPYYGAIKFKTGLGTYSELTEKMRITGDGKIGLGKSAPESAMHFVGFNGAVPQDYIEIDGTYRAGNGLNKIFIFNHTYWGSRSQEVASIGVLTTSSTAGSGHGYGNLVFHTGESGNGDSGSTSTERMRITSGGNLLVGTTSATGTRADFRSSSTAGPVVTIGTANNAMTCLRTFVDYTDSRTHVDFYIGSTKQGSIVGNGSSVSYNTSSDYRLKENVVPMSGALDRVDALKPSQFNFTTDPDKIVDGFLAHEVQEVVPEAITGEKDEVDEEGNPIYQGIDQSKLVPLLTAAIQELNAKIQELENKLTANGIN